MNAPTQICKPSNWQDFETLCMKLWGAIWNCEDSIKKNGRNGQKQQGIDIWGQKPNELLDSGIQCKLKKDNNGLSKEELTKEIESAKYYNDSLQRLIIATTADKDVKIEEHVRLINRKHKKDGLFEVHLFCWDDIVDKMIDYPRVYNWYLGKLDIALEMDLSIMFDTEDNSRLIIRPEYEKVITRYVLPNDPKYLIFQEARTNLENFSKPAEILKSLTAYTTKEVLDKTWCKIPMCISNTGNISVNVVKCKIDCYANNVNAVAREIPTLASSFISSWDAIPPEVLTAVNYEYGIIYQPRERLLVPKDNKHFHFYIQPKEGIQHFEIACEILCKEYNKTMNLNISIEPIFHPRIIYEVVDSEEFVKEVIDINPYKA